MKHLDWLKKTSFYIVDNFNRKWQIPVRHIVNSHASHYKDVDKISLDESIKNTCELFMEDNFEAGDWARNNMNWSDVSQYAVLILDTKIDMQEEWVNPQSIFLKTEN